MNAHAFTHPANDAHPEVYSVTVNVPAGPYLAGDKVWVSREDKPAKGDDVVIHHISGTGHLARLIRPVPQQGVVHLRDLSTGQCSMLALRDVTAVHPVIGRDADIPDPTAPWPDALSAPLPAGEYTFEIVESQYVATRDGAGFRLRCKAQMVQEKWPSPIRVFEFTLEHSDDTRQEIGQRDFAVLRRATGVLAPETTDELLFKPFKVKQHANGRLQYLLDAQPARDQRGRFRKAA